MTADRTPPRPPERLTEEEWEREIAALAGAIDVVGVASDELLRADRAALRAEVERLRALLGRCERAVADAGVTAIELRDGRQALAGRLYAGWADGLAALLADIRAAR